MILLTVLAFNFVGDGLDDAIDPSAIARDNSTGGCMKDKLLDVNGCPSDSIPMTACSVRSTT